MFRSVRLVLAVRGGYCGASAIKRTSGRRCRAAAEPAGTRNASARTAASALGWALAASDAPVPARAAFRVKTNPAGLRTAKS